MKKFYIVFMIALLLISGRVYAQESNNLSVEQIIDEIKTEQNIANISDVNCDQVSDEQFEELGDALMSLMHPDEREHELMDNMMGGEGSESLSSMHIRMGGNYLNCYSPAFSSTNIGMMGMMGSGSMMGSGFYRYNSDDLAKNHMFGYDGFGLLSLFSLITIILIWVLIILAILAIIKWLIKKK